jgi:hypothetical protein
MNDEIYNWTYEQSGELKTKDFFKEEYISTDIEAKIIRLFDSSKNCLIVIQGKAGSGKSCLTASLRNELIKKGTRVFPVIFGAEEEYSILEKGKDITDLPKLESEEYLTIGNVVDGLHLLESFNDYDFLVGKRYLYPPSARLNKKISKQYVEILICEFSDRIFDKKSVLKHFDHLYRLWITACKTGKTIIMVVSLKTSIWEQVKTYSWFNKFDVHFLNMTPDELVDIFNKRFTKIDPFTIESLHTIAEKSETNPRKYKRNIRKALDYASENQISIITKQDVDMIFKSDQISITEKMVRSILIDEELIITSLKVIDHLLRNGDTGQSVLCDKFFNGSKSKTSKTLKKLEKAQLIWRKRDGVRKKVSLVPS